MIWEGFTFIRNYLSCLIGDVLLGWGNMYVCTKKILNSRVEKGLSPWWAVKLGEDMKLKQLRSNGKPFYYFSKNCHGSAQFIDSKRKGSRGEQWSLSLWRAFKHLKNKKLKSYTVTVSNQNLVDNFVSGYRLIDLPSCILEQKDKTCNDTHTHAREQHLKFAVKEGKKRWKRKRIERKKRIMNGQIGEGGRNVGRMSSSWREGRNSEKKWQGGREWDSFQFPYLSLSLYLFVLRPLSKPN